MQWLILITLLAYIVLDAVAQGKINLINREYVPPSAQADVNVPLHLLYPACYAVLSIMACIAGAAASAYWEPRWALIALCLRGGLFNPILNLTKGDQFFAVGTSSKVDKLMGRAEWVRVATTFVGLAAATIGFLTL